MCIGIYFLNDYQAIGYYLKAEFMALKIEINRITTCRLQMGYIQFEKTSATTEKRLKSHFLYFEKNANNV